MIRKNYSIIKLEPMKSEEGSTESSNEDSTLHNQKYFLKEVNGIIVFIPFFQLSEDQQIMIDKMVVNLFHVIGDAFGGITVSILKENSISVLRVGITRWLMKELMLGSR
jgi:hypothetical protein